MSGTYNTIYSFIACQLSAEERTEIAVKSSFQLDLPPQLILPSSSIELNETIGQGIFNFVLYLSVSHVRLCYYSGEFGIVYKGYIKIGNTKSMDEYLAIKTLKGNHEYIG